MTEYSQIDGYIINSRGLQLALRTSTAKNINVYYHQNCLDGSCSAALMQHLFENAAKVDGVPRKYTYMPVNYGNEFPMQTIEKPDTLCIMVDFSAAPEVLQEINSRCEGLLVIDHHKSAVEAILKYGETTTPEFGYILGDKNNSGASLVYEIFYDKLGLVDITGTLTQIVSHCRIHDTWRHNGVITDPSYGFATAIYSAGEHTDKNVASYQMSLMLTELFRAALKAKKEYTGSCYSEESSSVKIPSIEGLCAIGNKMLKTKELEALAYVEAGKHAYLQQDERIYNFLAVKAPYRAASMVGTVGYTVNPVANFIAIYEDKPDSDEYVISLRTRQGGVDVSAVAKFYGGGGHASAAGFKVKKEIWDAIVNK
jgi:oligoribonuclease NrnB/cAMP/cGMP phosphodiesterase (DHH superfamily)